MNKQTLISELKKDIKAKNKVVEILDLLEKKAETLKHYKKIDGRYINKLSEVIPIQESWYNEYTKKDVHIYYANISKANYSDYYIIHFKFDIEGKHYENNYYLSLYQQELTTEKVANKINEITQFVLNDIEKIENDLSNIDNVIKWHNELVEFVENARNEQDKLSYSTKKLLPEIKLPYVRTEYDCLD